jgi:hypothetical protein
MIPMNFRRRRTTFLSSMMVFLGITFIAGCGDGTPSIDTSLNEATVRGQGRSGHGRIDYL